MHNINRLGAQQQIHAKKLHLTYFFSSLGAQFDYTQVLLLLLLLWLDIVGSFGLWSYPISTCVCGAEWFGQ